MRSVRNKVDNRWKSMPTNSMCKQLIFDRTRNVLARKKLQEVIVQNFCHHIYNLSLE